MVQMQSAHAHQNMGAHAPHNGAPQRPSSERLKPAHPERLNNLSSSSSEGRIKGATVFNPTIATHKHNIAPSGSRTSNSKPQGHSNNGGYGSNNKREQQRQAHRNKNSYLGNTGGRRNSYIEEETESEFSDEDKEYVYYVNANASHV